MKNDLYNISETEIEEFDQLYDGTIDEKDYYLLKARLELDEILKHKYNIYKLFRKQVEQDGLAIKVLKSRFINLDNQIKKRKRIKRFWFGFTVSAAAIVFLILNISPKNSNKKIYEKYRYSEIGLPVLMNDSKASKMDSIMILMGSNQYEKAYKALESISENDTISYFKAFCIEQLGDQENASLIYEKLENSKSINIKQKSEFRIALLSIISNKQKPLEKMEVIASNSTHIYQKLAQEIVSTSIK